jgi:hypothetical protein
MDFTLSTVLTSPLAPSFAEALGQIRMDMAAMHHQLSALVHAVQRQEQLFAQLATTQHQVASHQQQIVGLHDRLAQQEEESRVQRLEITQLRAALEQQHQAMAPMQQQLAKLEQRPVSYAAAVAGPAPTPSPTTTEYQHSFRMPLGETIKAGAPYKELVTQLTSAIGGLLKEGDAPFQLAHVENVRIVSPKARPVPAGSPATPAPPPFVVFKVSEGDAMQIAKLRRQLAGSGVTISDWLTPEENKRRRALMPQFKEARNAKLKAYWRRAQLFVEGAEVPLPPAAAAPAAA